MNPLFRPSLIALALAGLVVAPLHAAEHKEAAPEAPAAEAKAADAKSGDAKAGSAKGGEADAAATPADALERLRQRLEEKLGATKAPGSATGNDLRIPSKAAAEPVRRVALAHRPKPAPVEVELPLPLPRLISWDYNAGSSGPSAWSALRPEYALCGSGNRQSPINIRNGIGVDLAPVQFDYRPSAFTVLDDGHTVRVTVASGNTISVGNRRWELVGLDFHLPSENRIDGRGYDMEMHLFHQDAEGHSAVVALMLARGRAQNVVQTIWNNLPLERNAPAAGLGTIDLAQLLPPDRRYYNYMGSLTSPPCSEGVEWIVLNQPVEVSQQQIDTFAHLYPMNARPLQQADGRLIKQSR